MMNVAEYKTYMKNNDEYFYNTYSIRFRNGEHYAGFIHQYSSLGLKNKWLTRLTIDIPTSSPRTISYILFTDRKLVNEFIWYYFNESNKGTVPTILTRERFLYTIMKPLLS